MASMRDKELYSRSSFDTNNLDMETGEGIPHKKEEEPVHGKVRIK